MVCTTKFYLFFWVIGRNECLHGIGNSLVRDFCRLAEFYTTASQSCGCLERSILAKMVPFRQNGKIAKMAMKFLKNQTKDFLRHYESATYKNIHNLFQGLPNPEFRSVKVQSEAFLKKDSRNFKIFYLGFLSYESLASLESKIRRCPFLVPSRQ